MELFDPHRPRINDQPELLGRRFAIPRLTLFPCEDNSTTTIGAMIPHSGNSRYAARQVLRTVPDTMIPEILSQYRKDPEQTLETLFGITLAPITEPNDYELARSLAKERNTKPKLSDAELTEKLLERR